MPIRADLRRFYGPAWRKEIRPRILARAENRCEQCGKPNGQTVMTVTTRAKDDGRPVMWWTLGAGLGWQNHYGEPAELPEGAEAMRRVIRVKIGVAHLNHDPADNRDENLKALCDWCHLHYDAPHHRESRATRKDSTRPLLQEAVSR